MIGFCRVSDILMAELLVTILHDACTFGFSVIFHEEEGWQVSG
jgi:hypothetical protein